jgi:hypothetical protein
VEGGYRLTLFADQDTVTGEDVVAMWISEVGLPESEARRRVSELLLVATSRGDELAAVGTAYLQRNDQLRADVWHLRAFVSAAHRMSHLAYVLALASRDHLEQRFVRGQDQRGIGLLFEIEHRALKSQGAGEMSRFMTRALWHLTDSFFIGENASGDHVRVHYFPGARAPEPDA